MLIYPPLNQKKISGFTISIISKTRSVIIRTMASTTGINVFHLKPILAPDPASDTYACPSCLFLVTAIKPMKHAINARRAKKLRKADEIIINRISSRGISARESYMASASAGMNLDRKLDKKAKVTAMLLFTK